MAGEETRKKGVKTSFINKTILLHENPQKVFPAAGGALMSVALFRRKNMSCTLYYETQYTAYSVLSGERRNPNLMPWIFSFCE